MGLIKDLKPWLTKRFEVTSDRADLYAYFFERGIKLLKPGGRLGFISSSTFFRTGSGAPLRDFLRHNAALECVINFGDHQIFEGVTTYPAILSMKAGAPQSGHELHFWNVGELPRDNFDLAFREHSGVYPQDALSRGPWELEDAARRSLSDKIRAGRRTLKQIYGSPLYGIKTGLNEAFVINTSTKEQLCRDDPRSAELLKPFLEGKDLKRWHAESRGLWIIYIPKKRIKIDDYPAVRDWLLPFKSKLESRATVQAWFELQQAQEAYSTAFTKPKIVYSRFLKRAEFAEDDSGTYINNALFALPGTDKHLVALLNSNICWAHLRSQSTDLSGGFSQADAEDLANLPIPAATDAQKAELAVLAEAARSATEERYDLQQEITRRIPDLRPGGKAVKLTERLKAWWDLPDFAAFQREVKNVLKADIPLKDRNEWESWISQNRSRIRALNAEIARIEDEINERVYALFDLTANEVELFKADM